MFSFFQRKITKAKSFALGLETVTDQGLLEVDDLKVGANLLGLDYEGDKGEVLNRVEDIEKISVNGNFYCINEKVLLYENQSVVSNGNVTHAKLLRLGDELVGLGGKKVVISSLRRVQGKYHWYRLTVKSNHTYFLNGILVHNASRFWRGGTGNWDAVTTTNWSGTSGGAGGASVPTSADSVTFDANSGGGTCTVTAATANVQSITMGAYTNGTFNANGFAINTAGNFSISGSVTRNVTLGSSTVTCSSFTATTTTGLTFSGASSTITTGAAGNFQPGSGMSFGTVNIRPNGAITIPATTYVNLNYSPTTPTKTASLTLSGNVTVTGTFTLNSGATVTNRIWVKSSVRGTARTITAAAVSINNADFEDITAAGAASWNLSAIAGGSGNCGGNTGITFTTPTTQHWLTSTGGNWSSVGNWTSRVPLPQDTAVMDKAFGASMTVAFDMPRCGPIDWTGATWTTALTWSHSSIAHEVFGGITLISGLTITATTNATTIATRSNVTLDTKGVSFDAPIIIDSVGGTVTLGGHLVVGPTANKNIQLINGTFTANNFNVTISGQMGGNGTASGRVINMGSGTWTISGNTTTQLAWSFFGLGTGLTVNAGTSVIRITNVSATALFFAGAGKTYNEIWWDRGAATGDNSHQDANTFETIRDTGTAAHSLKFAAGTTTTTTNFLVSGSPGNIISINSSTTATHSLVKTGGGVVSCDYLNIQHSVATPSSAWYAGVNSVNNQAVATAGSGWIFTVPPVAPTVTTQAATSVGSTTATGNGNVTSDGGSAITQRGIAVSTSPNPTTSDSIFTSAGTTGAFTASITGLTGSTLYYVRAYAINAMGTSYGSDETFTTNPASTTVTNNRSAELTGSISTADARTAETHGVITLNDTRDSTLHGQSTSVDFRSTEAHGIHTQTDIRDAEVHGVDVDVDSRDSELTGTMAAAEEKDSELHGVAAEGDMRDVELQGSDVANNSRGSEAIGVLDLNDSRSSELNGVDSAASTISAQLSGVLDANDSRATELHGTNTADDLRTAETTGADATFDSRSAETAGIAFADTVRTVELPADSDAISETDAELVGSDTSSLAVSIELHGTDTATDYVPAELVGMAFGYVSRDVELAGISSVIDSRASQLSGISTVSDSSSAELHGVNTASDSRTAELNGISTEASERQAELAGIQSANSARGAILDGVMPAQPYTPTTKPYSSQNRPYTPQESQITRRGSPYTPKQSPYARNG